MGKQTTFGDATGHDGPGNASLFKKSYYFR
jgi:hypothetical protein